jgi:hypothetical protein
MSNQINNIDSAPESQQIQAVKADSSAIKHIRNPSEAVQLAAVEHYGSSIIYLIQSGIKPSIDVQTAAVVKNGDILFHSWEQLDVTDLLKSSKVKTAVIKSIMSRQKFPFLALSLCYFLKEQKVVWPELEVIEKNLSKLLTESNISDDQSEQIRLVQQSSWAIEKIPNPSIEVQLAAVNSFGTALKHIKNPSPEVQMAAVKRDGWAIQYIKNPSLELQIAAIKNHGSVIRIVPLPISEALWKSSDVKRSVLKNLLEEIKLMLDYRRLIKFLKDNNCPWPELETIKKSINKNTISESVPPEKGYPILLELQKDVYKGIIMLHSAGYKMSDFPFGLKIIERKKREILSDLLKTARQGRYREVLTMVSTLHDMAGIDWRELRILDMESRKHLA